MPTTGRPSRLPAERRWLTHELGMLIDALRGPGDGLAPPGG
jgi:hypothetical protein